MTDYPNCPKCGSKWGTVGLRRSFIKWKCGNTNEDIPQPDTCRIRELERELAEAHKHLDEKWGRDPYLGHIQTANTKLRAKRDALIEALTPSAGTKCEYMGEWEVVASHIGHTVDIPWTTIKDIMAAIRNRAQERLGQ